MDVYGCFIGFVEVYQTLQYVSTGKQQGAFLAEPMLQGKN